jgi:predicted transcriptional regulator
MKTEYRIADLVQRILDKKKEKYQFIKKIEILYRENINTYVIYVSVNRTELLEEYEKMMSEATIGYWGNKFRHIIERYLSEPTPIYYDILDFTDVDEIDEIRVYITKIFYMSNVSAVFLDFRLILEE